MVPRTHLTVLLFIPEKEKIMIILGIDPGSVIVGYSIIEKEKGRNPCLRVIDFGCIITDKFATTGERLKKVHDEIAKLIKKYRPDILSIETCPLFS